MALKSSICEVFMSRYLPAIKAAIAKELIERYGYSQLRAAKMVGLKQPELNYILHGKRRSRELNELINNSIFRNIVREVAEKLHRGEDVSLCSICSTLRSSNIIRIGD